MDAKRLMMKLKEHDGAADMLITDVTNLGSKLKSMKQVLTGFNLKNLNLLYFIFIPT